MATDWLQEQAEAYADFEDEGAFFAITRTSEGQFDPIAGQYTEGTEEKFSVPGFLKMLFGGVNGAIKWKPESTVEVGDKMLMLAAQDGGYYPQVEDRITLADGDWRIKATAVVEPATIPIVHFVLIRRS